MPKPKACKLRKGTEPTDAFKPFSYVSILAVPFDLKMTPDRVYLRIRVEIAEDAKALAQQLRTGLLYRDATGLNRESHKHIHSSKVFRTL